MNWTCHYLTGKFSNTSHDLLLFKSTVTNMSFHFHSGIAQNYQLVYPLIKTQYYIPNLSNILPFLKKKSQGKEKYMHYRTLLRGDSAEGNSSKQVHFLHLKTITWIFCKCFKEKCNSVVTKVTGTSAFIFQNYIEQKLFHRITEWFGLEETLKIM